MTDKATISADIQMISQLKPDGKSLPVSSSSNSTSIAADIEQISQSPDKPLEHQDPFEEVHQALDYIGKGLDYSRKETANALGWTRALTGEISNEEAKVDYNPNRMDAIEAQDIKAYETLHPVTLQRGVKEVLGNVPALMQMAIDGLKGSVVLGAPMAAAGAVAGGEAMTFAAPFTEAVSIPAGSAAGALWQGSVGSALGFRAGLSIGAARIAAGAMYGSLINKNVPRKQALPAALAAGAIGGLIQGWQLNRLPLVAKRAIFSNPQFKRTALQTTIQLAKELGIQVAATDTQEAADIAIEALVGNVGNHHIPTQQEITDRMTEATVKGGVTGATLIGGAHLAGMALNATIPKTPVAKAMTSVKAILMNPEETENVKLIEMKAKLDVAKAEEKLSNAQTKLAEAQKEGEPTKVHKLEVEVAQLELEEKKAAMPTKPVLEGKVEKTEEAAKPTKEEKAEKKDNELMDVAQKIDDVIDAAKSKYFIEKNSTDLQNVKRYQGLIKKLVKKSGLTEDQQGEFLSAVANIHTEADLVREAKAVADRLVEKLQKVEHAKAIKDLNSQLNAIEPTKEGYSKFTFSDKETTIQDVLNTYKDFIENKDKAAKASKDYLDAEIALKDITPTMDMEYAIAGRVGMGKEGTTQSIRKLTDEIESIRKDGLKGRLEQRANEAKHYKEMVEEFIALQQGNKPINISETAGEKTRISTSEYSKYLKRSGASISTFEDLLHNILQDTPPAKREAMMKQLNTTHFVAEVQNLRDEWRGKYIKSIMNATGKSRLDTYKMIARNANKKNPVVIGYINQNGVKSTAYLTRNEAITLYSQIKYEESAWRGLKEGNGYTKDNDAPGFLLMQNQILTNTTEKALREALTDEDIKVLEAVHEFNREFGLVLQTAFHKATGIRLALEKFYSFPLRRKGFKSEMFNNDLLQGLAQVQQDKFSGKYVGRHASTIERQDSPLPLQPMDIHKNAMMHISSVVHYSVWQPQKQYGRIFNNANVREILKVKHGNAMAGDVDMMLTDLIRGQISRQGPWLDILQHLQSNAPVIRLFLQWKRFPMHYFSIVNFAHAMPPEQLALGYVEYYANMAKYNKILDKSIVLNNRYASPFERVITGSIDEADEFAHERTLVNEVMGSPLKYGDKWGPGGPGIGAYIAYRLSQGASEEEALHDAEIVMERTQFSHSADQVSNAARAPGFTKMIMQMTQQPTHQFVLQMQAWRDFINHPSWNSFGRALYVSALVRLSQMLFEITAASMRYIFASNDNERDQAIEIMITSLLAGPLPPVVGAVLLPGLVMAYNKVTGQNNHYFTWEALPVDAVHNFGKLVSDVMKLQSEEDSAHQAARLAQIGLDYAGSINYLMPKRFALPTEPFRWFKDVTKFGAEDVKYQAN